MGNNSCLKSSVLCLSEVRGQNSEVDKNDPWGKIESKTESITVPFSYAGYYYDEETDLYYLNARYYKPDMQRFISRDPNPCSPSEPQSLNRYTYCGNNPVSRVDIDGKHWIPVDYVAKQIKRVQQYARNNGYPPPDRVVNHFGNSNGGSYYGHNARHTRKGNVSGRSTNKLVSTYKARKAVKADIDDFNKDFEGLRTYAEYTVPIGAGLFAIEIGCELIKGGGALMVTGVGIIGGTGGLGTIGGIAVFATGFGVIVAGGISIYYGRVTIQRGIEGEYVTEDE